VAESAATSDAKVLHSGWVRIFHWMLATVVLLLFVTGVFILAVHPRLYWGEVGNDMMPALIEIPISNNHQPELYEAPIAFALPGEPFSAARTYPIFNQNGWARSLHFVTAWVLVLVGLLYVGYGLLTGHIRHNLIPKLKELSPVVQWRDATTHSRDRRNTSRVGPPYGYVQKTAYSLVVLVALPLMLVTGVSMSPAVTASFPFLLDIFGGYQSARTLHFFAFAFLLLFFLVHVVMVVLTGIRQQLRAMTWGK
jgi:thiosulfate reductase cytochrome b subunit